MDTELTKLWLQAHGAQAEDDLSTVAEFLAGAVQESMSDNDVEEIDYLDDMLPMIGTICPLFEALEPESQREELRGLINGTWAPTESQGCSRRSSSIESSGSDGDGGEGEEEDINILAGICGASKAYLRHVLRDKFGGDLQRAAAWLLESPVAALERSWREEKLAEECPTCHDAVSWRAQERAAEEEEERQRQRRLVVERFSFQIATKGDERECPPALPGSKGALKTRKEREKEPQARYRDGKVVSQKGEKYIVEKVGEEWDGGSRGKVYTKGKRGVGFR